MPKKPRPLPQSLREAQKQFEQWRSTRTSRTISEPLWSLAIEQAIEHGSFPTAKALRLNSHTLKKRLSGSQGKPAPRSKTTARAAVEPTFIAVDPISTPTRTLTGEGSVEIETADGARMRIEWRRGEAPPDLLALGRSLFGGGR